MALASTAAMEDHVENNLLLDGQWQRQQQKTFTAWVNGHLRKVNLHVDNLETDLCDGVALLALLEIIGDATLPKPAKGKMRIHKIQNVGAAFQFIKEKGVKLVSIGPEEIVDGNLKMILGMIWTLILRFEIQDISVEEMSAKDALLLWCQRKTEPYKNVSVRDFHMSFKDGLAFCALIHRHRPELINYDSLRKDDPLGNLKLAVETADKHLDIPPMLDPEDIVSCIKPDERSIMTYVAAYYKAFASSNKADVAAKKIATVLETNREHERLIQEYETRASNLLQWIRKVIVDLEERPNLNSVASCQAKLDGWNQFRAQEYPPKIEEKGELENHYSTLQTKLRLSGRPAYVPSEGNLISDIKAAWTNLESAETSSKEWLIAELRRNQLAENKAEKFRSKVQAHNDWLQGKEALLTSEDYVNANLGAIVALKKKHEAFQSDLQAHEAGVVEIGTLANELDDLRYANAADVNQQYATIYEGWQQLTNLSTQREAKLVEYEAIQQKLDGLHLEFAKQAPTFCNWAESAKSQLTATYLADNPADVQALQQGFQAFQEELVQHNSEIDGLAAIQNEIQSLSPNSVNPYSYYSYEIVKSMWNEVQQLTPARQQQLADEAAKQDAREQLRHSWATNAQTTQDYLTEKVTAVKATLDSADFEKMEDQAKAIQQIDAEVTGYKSNFDHLEVLHKQVQEALIFENPHTKISIESLRGLYHTLSSGIKKSLTELNNQILTRDAKNITEDQLRTYRESFKHFDKDGSGKLDKLEFRACLIACEYDIPQVAVAGQDQEFERVLARVDPNNDGYVTFDEFIAFMAELHANAETSDQLLQAFQVLAAGQPYVTEAQLRKELVPDLAEYCIQNMSPYEGGPEGALDYKSFASALYGETDL